MSTMVFYEKFFNENINNNNNNNSYTLVTRRQIVLWSEQTALYYRVDGLARTNSRDDNSRHSKSSHPNMSCTEDFLRRFGFGDQE